MTELVWDTVGERYYEAGVDKGVFYGEDSLGVSWNGLVSVSESSSDSEIKSYYLDGKKYLQYASSEEFTAILQAFTYPDEFAEFDGVASVQNGLYVAQQERKTFGLSYRTLLGSDSSDLQHGYKIHLVYNVIVIPEDRSYSSLSEQINPLLFSWKISTKPKDLVYNRPAAHFIIDSTETPSAVMEVLSNFIYGTATTVSKMPTISELLAIFDNEIIDGGPPIPNNTNPIIDGGLP